MTLPDDHHNSYSANQSISTRPEMALGDVDYKAYHLAEAGICAILVPPTRSMRDTTSHLLLLSGSIILDGIGIVVALLLLWRSQRKRAAVGRREMQLFLLGYILIDICEIFSIGGFPLKSSVRTAFTGIHIGAITATTWILMLNGAVGYQAIDDGTPLSLGLIFGSAAAIFIGTGYLALDQGYSWSGYFDPSLTAPNRNYALYTLYLLAPIVFLSVYFLLETVLVIKVLGETRPLSKSSRKALKRASGCRSQAYPRHCSIPLLGRPSLRDRSDFRLRHQCSYLQRHRWPRRRRAIRDLFHPRLGRPSLGLLVKHHRRRLAAG